MKSNNKQETSSSSCRFEGIRIRSQPGCTGFKRDGADSDAYDSGGGDVVELTFWSLEGTFAIVPHCRESSTVSYVYTPSRADRKKLEAFVKQGKGKSSKSLGPFKQIPGVTSPTQNYIPYELSGSAPDGVRFASRAALSSTTLADPRSSRVPPTLEQIKMEGNEAF